MACDSTMPAMLQAEECHPDWNVSQEEGKNRDHKELWEGAGKKGLGS